MASSEELHDMISQHMEGYAKQEICSRHLEKTCPREMSTLTADEQKTGLAD